MPRSAVLPALLLPLLVACHPSNHEIAKTHALDSERQRVSYMVGLDLSKNVAPIKDEVDIDTVVRALRDAYIGESTQLDAAQADAVRTQFTEHLRDKRESERLALAAKNELEGSAFLASNAANKGVTVTPSGLQYQVIRDSSGAKPAATDTVRVNYTGKLLNGSTFEDTYATDHPASFALNQVLAGLREAVQLMPVGSKYKFWLPASLAYAERGLAATIEPNSTLVFEVELLEIAKQ